MEQPREPKVYPNTGDILAETQKELMRKGFSVEGKQESALQSIDSTLKRIEAILLEKKNRGCN